MKDYLLPWGDSILRHAALEKKMQKKNPNSQDVGFTETLRLIFWADFCRVGEQSRSKRSTKANALSCQSWESRLMGLASNI